MIYLDHAATTPVDPAVREAMLPYEREGFGNPNSLHRAGRVARRAVEQARARVADLIGAQPNEIVFTGGGTEADNLALFGGLGTGAHLIVSQIEHHAVLHAARALERRGVAVSYVSVDRHGRVNPDEVAAALREDTALVSIMAANNEVGTLQPIRELGNWLAGHPARFHTDAVQAVGHVPVDVNDWDVDLLTLSAHKFHGPKGVGALYARTGVELAPLLHGGGQEAGLRSGTENVAGIVGCGEAARLACGRFPADRERITRLRDRLIRGALDSIDGVALTGHPSLRLPGSASFTFAGAPGESLLLKLDMSGICVSTGSACASGRLDPSHVLLAMGLSKAEANGSLRFTLGRTTTAGEIDAVLGVLPDAVAHVRRLGF